MNEKMNKLVIGALLHDIGKLWQRGSSEKRKHGPLAAEKIRAKFGDIIGDCVEYHHADELSEVKEELAKDNLAYIVYEADNIAAGADRRDDAKSESKGYDRELALESVFNLLSGDKTKYSYDINDRAGVAFPKPSTTIKAGQYKYGVREDFDKDYASINSTICTPNSILKLCEKHLSLVPSDTCEGRIPDISLYDHQKITAAVAACMLSYFEESGITNYKTECLSSASNRRDKQRFMLLSGDLSGVQDFIYTIASKGALKSLRARSFYLELFIEHVADEILEALGLSRANLLYTGGGHFYILLPNTDKAKAVVDGASITINRWLYGEFGAKLYLALATEVCTANQLMNTSNEVFKGAGLALSKKKLRKYADNSELLAKVFTPHAPIDGERECSVCSTSSKQLSKHANIGEACPLCTALYEKGKTLLNRDYFYIVDGKNEEELQLPTITGEYCHVLFDRPSTLKRAYAKNKRGIANDAIDLDMGDYNWKPEGQKELADFGDYAERSDGGIKRIGCIRADVDNLGSVFSSGIGENYSSLTRMSMLSRQLNTFFKRYINESCANKRMAIVYAGGDDVFAVGAWDDIIDWAIELREAFGRYTCNKLTFSAGISLLPEKFPVWQMAERTGYLEELAKNHKENGKITKDAVTLFGDDDSTYDTEHEDNKLSHTYRWSTLIENVFGEKLKLLEECFYWDENDYDKADKLDGSTAFLYRVKSLIRNKVIDEELLNLPRMAYSLARMEPSSRASAAKHANYARVRECLYKWLQDDERARQLNTAIDYLIYRKRGN